MATLLNDPIFDAFDSNGDPIAGALAYFYLTGTTTNAAVYADNALTTPRTQPVVADASGRFANTYLDPSVTYRLIFKDAAGATIRDIDPLNPSGSIGTASITDGAVTTAKLATNAVTTVKITDANVTLAKMADLAAGSIIGRAVGAGTGAPTAITAAADLNMILSRVGEVFWFASETAPAGSIECDGASLLRAGTYANLFAVIGTVWGAADGTHFNVPDLRGEFIRGWDHGKGTDSGRVFASSQAADIAPHTHTYASVLTNMNSTGGTSATSAAGSGQTTGSTGTTETRPRNYALMACIRF